MHTFVTPAASLKLFWMHCIIYSCLCELYNINPLISQPVPGIVYHCRIPPWYVQSYLMAARAHHAHTVMRTDMMNFHFRAPSKKNYSTLNKVHRSGWLRGTSESEWKSARQAALKRSSHWFIMYTKSCSCRWKWAGALGHFRILTDKKGITKTGTIYLNMNWYAYTNTHI